MLKRGRFTVKNYYHNLKVVQMSTHINRINTQLKIFEGNIKNVSYHELKTVFLFVKSTNLK